MAEMMLSWLPKPDFVLYFDIGVSECLSRIYKRNTIIGNNENPVFLSKLKTELPRRIINNGVKMIILDASQDEKQIKSEMLNAIIENINLANYKEM